MDILVLIGGAVCGILGAVCLINAKKKHALQLPGLILLLVWVVCSLWYFVQFFSGGESDAKRIAAIRSNAVGYAVTELVKELKMDPLRVAVFGYGDENLKINSDVLSSLQSLNPEAVTFIAVYDFPPVGVSPSERANAIFEAMQKEVARRSDIYVFLTSFPDDCASVVPPGKKLILSDQREVGEQTRALPEFYASVRRNPEFEQKDYPSKPDEFLKKVFLITRNIAEEETTGGGQASE